jgi:hypothetical protein
VFTVLWFVSLLLSTCRASFIADIACFKSVHWELIPLILTGCPVLQSTWASLKASRTALDLHFVMRQVVEGMAACAEPKSTSVELAEACKRILPVAGNFRGNSIVGSAMLCMSD